MIGKLSKIRCGSVEKKESATVRNNGHSAVTGLNFLSFLRLWQMDMHIESLPLIENKSLKSSLTGW